MTATNIFHKQKARRLTALCLLLSGVVLASGPAAAQMDVQSRLNRLENELQTLNRAVYKGEAPPPEEISESFGGNIGIAPGGLEVRLSQIEADVRALTGRVEEIDHAARARGDTLEAALSDAERRIAELELRLSGGGGTATSAPATLSGPAGLSLTTPETQTSSAETPPPPSVTAGTPSSSPVVGSLGTLGGSDGNTAASVYQDAFTALRERRYDVAEKGFTDFLARWPDDALVPNAQYWLGETYYVRNDFERAARIFAESYQKFPQGPKAPDNLLKLALSLAGMGKKTEACLTFAQLKKEYPAGSVPVLTRAETEAAALGCQ